MMRYWKQRFANRNSQPLSALGKLELSVMEILWNCGESAVRDVVERLQHELAYTTVMTTLDRLYKKGLLDRRKEVRAFLYRPRYSLVQLQRRGIEAMIAEFLAGPQPAGDALISCLIDAVGQQDEELLAELEKKIRLKREDLDRRKQA